MANYGVINEARVQAQNIDAFNRTAQATVDVAGGGLVALANSVSQGNDVYTATVPVTGALTGLWMAYNPSNKAIADVAGNTYTGLSIDPRVFTNIANKPFATFKPKVGDNVVLTAECVASGSIASVVAGDYLNAANAQTVLARTAAVSGIPTSTTTFVVDYVGYISFPASKGSIGMEQQKVFGVTCVQE